MSHGPHPVTQLCTPFRLVHEFTLITPAPCSHRHQLCCRQGLDPVCSVLATCKDSPLPGTHAQGCFLAYFATNSSCTLDQFLTCFSLPPQPSPELKLPFCLSVWVAVWALPLLHLLHCLSWTGSSLLHRGSVSASVCSLTLLLLCDPLAVFQEGKNPSPSVLALLALPNTAEMLCLHTVSRHGT